MNDEIQSEVTSLKNMYQYTPEDDLSSASKVVGDNSRRGQVSSASYWLEEQEEFLDNTVVYYDVWKDDRLTRFVVFVGDHAAACDQRDNFQEMFSEFRFRSQYVDDGGVDMISLELDF